jgi:hypothetical protein
MTIRSALLTSLLLGLMLCGCAPSSRSTPAETAPPGATAGAPASPVMPKPAAASPDDIASAKQVDYGCESDADCAVKNIGNCCGYYPACVNVDSPTFPEQVKQRCEADGMSSICGFPDISACRCVENRCEAAAGGGLKLD